MILNNQEPEKGQILLYQTEDQGLRLECRFVGDTLWLSQAEICTLYGKAKATISEHISNVLQFATDISCRLQSALEARHTV